MEIAEKALIRLGFDSKSQFAKSKLIARSAVTKFFQSKPIQLDTFKKICQELTLDWRVITGIAEQEQSNLERSQRGDLEEIRFAVRLSSEPSEGVEQMQASKRQITVIEPQTQQIKAVIVLEGDINSKPNFQLIASILREYSGDTINITDIQSGSIRLIIEGSQEDINQLISRFKTGEIQQLDGFSVKDIQVLSETDDENRELNTKWNLVREIASNGARGYGLKGVNLSDADLSGADLNDADLSWANLSDADLSKANLSRADLSVANLSEANLSGANLSEANLSGVDLSRVDLSKADLSRAYLSGANLSDADLSRANLRGANLSQADLSGANLSDADLSGANLSGANLSWVDLSDADLSRANLRGADLSDAYLSKSDLRGANLSGANLSVANLSWVDLSKSDLSRARVKNTQFKDNVGISNLMKLELIERGAIFKDSLGERFSNLTRFKK